MGRSLAGGWLFLVAGCLQTLPDVNGTATADTSSGGESSTSAGTGITTRGATSTGDPVQHPGCELPLPDPLPPVPEIRVDGAGRPTFAAWEAVDCGSALLDEVAPCAQDVPCADGVCLLGSPSAGVCTEIDPDSDCAGGLEAMGWQDGGCWACAPPLVHARACCTFADQGFDCRLWPFPADGVFGSVCARHGDCEPGLICGPHVGSGFGICQCPGLDPRTVIPDPGCY